MREGRGSGMGESGRVSGEKFDGKKRAWQQFITNSNAAKSVHSYIEVCLIVFASTIHHEPNGNEMDHENAFLHKGVSA